MIKVLIAAVAGGVLSGVLGYFLLPVLRALKAGQSIRELGPTWHNNKAGTPMMGGLMFIGAAIICLLLCIPMMQDYTALYVLAVSLCFGAVGFVDDFCKIKFKRNMGLTSLQKALLQMAVCALYLYLINKDKGTYIYMDVPFTDWSIKLHLLLYVFVAMFIMVGCVNAVNLTDGVDGLCGSVTVPVMAFFAVAAVAKDKYDLAFLPAIMTGALIAYLFYNWHPAKVFMGDTGSLFLGGAVCAMAFALDMPLVLLLIGIVYIVETLSVILQVAYFKLTHGKRLFKMSPIHHHFEMSGWKEEKICIVFTFITVIGCVTAWFGII